MIELLENEGIAFAIFSDRDGNTAILLRSKNDVPMNWLFLFIAGLLEIGFSISLVKMKDTSGLLFAGWAASFLFFLFASLWLMYKAVETIPMGTAYAVWTGIGSVGTVIVGIIFFKEPTDFWRLFFICTLILSLIGLKIVSD